MTENKNSLQKFLINTVEKTIAAPPTSLGNSTKPQNDRANFCAEQFLLKFISAYRKTYGSNHVLLIEDQKATLDNKTFAEAVLTD